MLNLIVCPWSVLELMTALNESEEKVPARLAARAAARVARRHVVNA